MSTSPATAATAATVVARSRAGGHPTAANSTVPVGCGASVSASRNGGRGCRRPRSARSTRPSRTVGAVPPRRNRTVSAVAHGGKPDGRCRGVSRERDGQRCGAWREPGGRGSDSSPASGPGDGAGGHQYPGAERPQPRRILPEAAWPPPGPASHAPTSSALQAAPATSPAPSTTTSARCGAWWRRTRA